MSTATLTPVMSKRRCVSGASSLKSLPAIRNWRNVCSSSCTQNDRVIVCPGSAPVTRSDILSDEIFPSIRMVGVSPTDSGPTRETSVMTGTNWLRVPPISPKLKGTCSRGRGVQGASLENFINASSPTAIISISANPRPGQPP